MERRSFLRSLLVTAIGAGLSIDIPALESTGLKTVALGKGGWHRVSFKWSVGSEPSLYVNGTQVADISNLQVSEVPTGYHFTCNDGDVSVYGVQLVTSLKGDRELCFSAKKRKLLDKQ